MKVLGKKKINIKRKHNKKEKKKISEKSKILAREVRVPTGIKGFDKIIENGFEFGSINMVVGDSGSGKTIFAMQFLMDGLKEGESCLYVTFEEKKDEFYDNMKDFGWDLAKYEKENKFFFLEYRPEKVRIMIEEGGGEIESIVLKNKISRLVIDSFTTFALLFKDELERRETALALFDILRKWKCTSILTLQENPKKRERSSSLEFEADGIILIYFTRDKKRNERERFMEVLKMRGTKHSRSLHKLEITNFGFKMMR